MDNNNDDNMGFTKGNSYILAVLTGSFVIGEVSHFLIGVVSQEMARSLHYGDKSCLPHSNASLRLGRTNAECESLAKDCESHQGCELLETGQGMKYQILAGPTFVVVFTLSGVLMGYLADKMPRPKLLSVAVILFSLCGALMGLAQEYWHLVVLRMGIAAGEAACRPASGSLIAEMFDSSTRGVANGIFSWGVYIGYGLTFVLGNYLGKIQIYGIEGWRAAFVFGCLPGLFLAVLLFFIQDPRDARKNSAVLHGEQKDYGLVKKKQNRKRSLVMLRRQEKSYFQTVLLSLLQPAMVLLFVATSVRHTGGYAWAYNTQNYLNEYYEDYNPGLWLTACSIFGGSFGVFVGGWLSDQLVKKFGLHSRLWLLSVTTILAAPCAAGVLSVEPPAAFGFLMVYYFLAETWFAILFTVLVEIVADEVRSVCLAIFLFLMNNVGGNLPVIVAPIADLYDLRFALYIIWAGFVAASGVLFFIASLPLWSAKSTKKSPDNAVGISATK